MASITIRKLDSKTKQWLRIRAAKNGRSMEEEARLLFDELQSNEGDPNSSNADTSNIVLAAALMPSPPQVVETNVARNDNSTARKNSALTGKQILLIISGGIAAYKCLTLIRRLREQGARIRTVMTCAAEEFVTPLSISALTAERVYNDLFSRDDEHDVGHIRLSRESDLVIVVPATANLIAKMANGLADDLATTILLATNKQVLIAPAMNPLMWEHSATSRNVQTLINDGIHIIGPGVGEMAESGEAGTGRMAEPAEILGAVELLLDDRPKPLAGLSAVVTSGPTREAIDPVRYLSNHSSGKQGHAIAFALREAGANVTLVSGPVSIPNPTGVSVVPVDSAEAMKNAVDAALPADIAIFVAAVADWRPATNADDKIKKGKSKAPPVLNLIENPDILKSIGTLKKNRPSLVIGFAAETQDIVKHGKDKLAKKGANWILANDVSGEAGVMGGDHNTIRLISDSGVEDWPKMDKQHVAKRLVDEICRYFEQQSIEI